MKVIDKIEIGIEGSKLYATLYINDEQFSDIQIPLEYVLEGREGIKDYISKWYNRKVIVNENTKVVIER